MTTLSDDQLEDIRQAVGDDCGDPYISDETLQAWYDATPDCMAQVYVYYLERLWAKALNEAKNLSTLGNVTTNPKASGIERLVTYWSKSPCVASNTLGGLRMGRIGLGIDSVCDDDYLTGW